MPKPKAKRTRHLERLVRGFSNHRRIEIMGLLARSPELSVAGIARELDINFKTASEHIRRLTIANIVLKRNIGQNVHHRLTDQGMNILKFLRTLK